jgi:hypothetical protein
MVFSEGFSCIQLNPALSKGIRRDQDSKQTGYPLYEGQLVPRTPHHGIQRKASKDSAKRKKRVGHFQEIRFPEELGAL